MCVWVGNNRSQLVQHQVKKLMVLCEVCRMTQRNSNYTMCVLITLTFVGLDSSVHLNARLHREVIMDFLAPVPVFPCHLNITHC